MIVYKSHQADPTNWGRMGDEQYTKYLSIWAPLICMTQAQADYIIGLCTLLGYDPTDKVFVKGNESRIGQVYHQGVEPTYINIPELSP